MICVFDNLFRSWLSILYNFLRLFSATKMFYLYFQEIFTKWTPGSKYNTKNFCPLRVSILEVTAVKRNKLCKVWKNYRRALEVPIGEGITT